MFDVFFFSNYKFIVSAGGVLVCCKSKRHRESEAEWELLPGLYSRLFRNEWAEDNSARALLCVNELFSITLLSIIHITNAIVFSPQSLLSYGPTPAILYGTKESCKFNLPWDGWQVNGFINCIYENKCLFMCKQLCVRARRENAFQLWFSSMGPKCRVTLADFAVWKLWFVRIFWKHEVIVNEISSIHSKVLLLPKVRVL